ncbi:MAG TPA: ABC transporter substrate-binding protein [Stellaceae bacterium]|nr:ABC transporter substrate-binding protein [Stellaceae bacterium]
MMTRRRAGLALGLALFVAAPAGAQQKPADITMAVPTVSLTFTLGYLADDLGLWAKNGLNVKSVQIAGVGAMNAVIAGSAQVTEASAITLTRATARGQKVLAIAEPLDRLIVEVVLRKDLAPDFDPKAPLEKRAALLKGRTIAVDSVNSIIHAYVRLLAHRAGMDYDDIRIAPMQPPSMIAAFEAKQIDGFAMSLPWPLEPVLKGEAVTIASGPAGDPADMVPFAHNVVVVRPDLCETRPEICAGIGKSIAEADDFLQDHPAEALALLQKRFSTLDPKLLSAAFDEVRSVTPRPPVPTAKALENADLYNIQAGLMRPDEKLKSYDAIFTDKYVK